MNISSALQFVAGICLFFAFLLFLGNRSAPGAGLAEMAFGLALLAAPLVAGAWFTRPSEPTEPESPPRPEPSSPGTSAPGASIRPVPRSVPSSAASEPTPVPAAPPVQETPPRPPPRALEPLVGARREVLSSSGIVPKGLLDLVFGPRPEPLETLLQALEYRLDQVAWMDAAGRTKGLLCHTPEEVGIYLDLQGYQLAFFENGTHGFLDGDQAVWRFALAPVFDRALERDVDPRQLADALAPLGAGPGLEALGYPPETPTT